MPTETELIQALTDPSLDGSQIARAIVALAKPYNRLRVERAAPHVLALINSPDVLVRHEVYWFIWWGKQTQAVSLLREAAMKDPDEDNREFAIHLIDRMENPKRSRIKIMGIFKLLWTVVRRD
jgi:hypothetical protein